MGMRESLDPNGPESLAGISGAASIDGAEGGT